MENSEYNLDQIIDILSKYNFVENSFSDPLNIKVLENCIVELLGIVTVDRSVQFHQIINDRHYRKFNFLEDSHKTDYEYDDLTLLSFTSLYPSIIKYLIDSKQIRFNIIGFDKLFVFLFDNRKKIKQIQIERGLDNKIYYNLRWILNCAYGLITSKKERFLFSDMEENLITKFVVEKIVNKLSFTNCVAGNTDEYYFDLTIHNINRSVLELTCEDFVKKYGLSFELIENHKVNFMEIQKFQHPIIMHQKLRRNF